jgi:glycosyltransferase involved in cell wall biosynthesis
MCAISLAAAGIPLYCNSGQELTDILPKSLADLVKGASEDDLTDYVRREEHSIRLRRYALRNHGLGRQWLDFAASRKLAAFRDPKISVLLCTRRPEMAEFALRQVSRQRGVDFEIILGLHGVSKEDDRIVAATAGIDVPVSIVEIEKDLPLGEALNITSGVAAGTFLAKMDDDDWYGPDHLADLTLAQLYSGADLIGSLAEFVYLEELDLTVCQVPEITAELPMGLTGSVLSGGTMLFSRSLFEAIGGFRAVPRFIDHELCDAFRSAGGRVYRSHGFNYLYRRRDPSFHTWQAPPEMFLRSSLRWPGRYFNRLMDLGREES